MNILRTFFLLARPSDVELLADDVMIHVLWWDWVDGEDGSRLRSSHLEDTNKPRVMEIPR